MGVPPLYEPGVSPTAMHCPPLARQGVAAWAAIWCLYDDTLFYDLVGLSAFSSLPFVGLWTVRVNKHITILQIFIINFIMINIHFAKAINYKGSFSGNFAKIMGVYPMKLKFEN